MANYVGVDVFAEMEADRDAARTRVRIAVGYGRDACGIGETNRHRSGRALQMRRARQGRSARRWRECAREKNTFRMCRPVSRMQTVEVVKSLNYIVAKRREFGV